jgi:hypothetical protein
LNNLASGKRLGEFQHLLSAAQMKGSVGEGQCATDDEQHPENHQWHLTAARDTLSACTGKRDAFDWSLPVGPDCLRRRHCYGLSQLPPTDAVLIAWDSVTVTAT